MADTTFKIEIMADKIADAVLSDLTDRAGFDAFWSDIDSDVRQEIRAAIGLNALEAMREPTVEMNGKSYGAMIEDALLAARKANG